MAFSGIMFATFLFILNVSKHLYDADSFLNFRIICLLRIKENDSGEQRGLYLSSIFFTFITYMLINHIQVYYISYRIWYYENEM